MATSTLRIVLELEDQATGKISKLSGTLQEIGKETDNASDGLKKLGIAEGILIGVGDQLVSGLSRLARGLIETTKESIMLAARYETMGTVLGNLAPRVGLNTQQMRELEVQLQDTGISMLGSRQAISQLIAAQIDLSHATELARIAQDGAVIANTNSTDSFERLIYGITSGQVRILRSMNLFVDFDGAIREYAKSIGKSTLELTELDRVQARTNAVLAAGSQIAGTYEAAMTTAGKQVTSLDRDIENLKVTLGEFAQGTFNEAVPAARQFTQDLTALLQATQLQAAALEAEGGSAITFGVAAQAAIPGFANLSSAWQSVVRWAHEQVAADEAAAASAALLIPQLDAEHQALQNLAGSGERAAQQISVLTVGTKELTKAEIGRQAMQNLDQALKDGLITQDLYDAAARTVMVTLLDMSQAQVGANFRIRELNASFEGGTLGTWQYVSALQGLNAELERLAENQPIMDQFAQPPTSTLVPGFPQGGSSSSTTTNMNLTINSKADTEDLQGQFKMMQAINAGAT